MWRNFRLLVWALRLSPAIWVLGAALLQGAGAPRWLAQFVFPQASFLALFPIFFAVTLRACPRCKETFFAPGRLSKHAVPIAIYCLSTCQNCGLRIGDGPDGRPKTHDH